ncbi:HAD-IA family hydrolase [Candidatus Venteria ishoeyi]|uniref:HAD family hydrolase n=1 Tax=Candidatus Venteria ishoeyi TaxID=1899563 RepID=UPI0025A50864|nr:HAD-IA family hydrolase [Candidatus Venteria ishoeyi]MDM8546675.1 HAD-IA family hydrolase [Candidatus Venteria ishoeyi]
MKQYQLLIFDWDGTVMDSIARIVSSFQFAIQTQSQAPKTDAEIRHIIGLGLLEAAQTLYPELPRTACQALADEYRHHYLEVNETATPLFPGVETTLKDLAGRYQLAVATSKSRRGLNLSMNLCGLGDLFQSSRCADETASKPNPLMLGQILAELNITPDQALMVGDSEYDLEMAVNAGVDAIGISHGVHDCERLQLYHPIHCIHHFTELSGIL